MSKEVILTGLRSNAEFHLGNYLGAILPMVELQKKHAGKYQLNMFVPDLHSFTTPIDHTKLYGNTLQNLNYFVAAGLDTDNPDTFIYRQSYIPAHSELTWILSCFSGFGVLLRLPQFKERMQQSGPLALKTAAEDSGLPYIPNPNLTAGAYLYPVLMAADILLYGAKYVPVGDDQRQHVEFTRDLATRMNSKFGELFVVPEDNAKQQEFAGRKDPVRIRSLRNPEKKMSKSVEDPAGTILLSDKPEEAAKKIMEATTDSVGEIHYDWQKQPGVSNLLQILDLLTNSSKEETNSHWEGKSSYGELKTEVAEVVKKFLSDFQAKLSNVDKTQLTQKLQKDEEAMNKVAQAKLREVQIAVGLRSKG